MGSTPTFGTNRKQTLSKFFTLEDVLEITSELVAKYLGCQMQIFVTMIDAPHHKSQVIYQGEVETAELKDGRIEVKFKWQGKHNPRGVIWRLSHGLLHDIMVSQCFVAKASDGRLIFFDKGDWEVVIWLPKDSAENIDPWKIQGYTS